MSDEREPRGFWSAIVGFLVDSKVVVFLLVALLVIGGLIVAPLDLEELGIDGEHLPRAPVSVDAIPDLGDNQQVVFVEWAGQAPRDVEDQVTYPLTTALLGLQGVRTVRSTSSFGFATLYVVFEEGIGFYDSRTRLLEKLASLPPDLLPPDVAPTMGPDATSLGQVYWYTLEGRDADGNTVGGFDLHELRTLQDFTVRPALQAVPGVSEVASVGGHVVEYQIEVDPEQLRSLGLTLGQVANAARNANSDVGARTLELNDVEYVVRGLGRLRDPDDLENAVVVVRDDTPIRLGDVARIGLGPATRRGALDDAGAEVVGGVVTVRFGEDPFEVLGRVRDAIGEIAPGLPRRTLDDGTEAQVTLVPFYDRSELIREVQSTLTGALWQQLLVTLVVVLLMLRSLGSGLLVSLLPPLGVLFAFVGMKAFGVQANVMALAGVAIAIGTMVDVGIVFTENVTASLRRRPFGTPRRPTVIRAAAEVAPAVLVSVLTTVVAFLPVFGLTGAEGKLFGPLAWTKTLAMIGAFVVALVVVPPAAHLLLARGRQRSESESESESGRRILGRAAVILVAAAAAVALAIGWAPLGPTGSTVGQLAFVAASVAILVGGAELFRRVYPAVLRFVLINKGAFAVFPVALIVLGAFSWLGAPKTVFGESAARLFPGLRPADVPPFDEGAFLYMPTTMPHASFGEALELLQRMDAAIAEVPEVDRVVGKLGRADTPLDPAPISMFETMIFYRPEYAPGPDGEPVRQWRDDVRTPHDIWEAITRAADLPGVTDAPVLQPISTRIIMNQTGMRGRVGLKVHGPDEETLETFGVRLEEALRNVPELRPESVQAERTMGKPYLELVLDRDALAARGLTVDHVQSEFATAIGGRQVGFAIEGRARRKVVVRYPREERHEPEALLELTAMSPSGPVPIGEVASLRYVRGPQMIRAEDTFLTSYVLFDPRKDVTDVDAVGAAEAHLDALVEDGSLVVPEGVRWRFDGTYRNQIRASRSLMLLGPLALLIILMLIYLQFRSLFAAFAIGAGVLVAGAGGFVVLWLWGLSPGLAATGLGQVFGLGPVPLTVAVWVGFIALAGIAVDDGVVMATYLDQRFRDRPPTTPREVRAAVLEAGRRRIRPCLMTTATTLLALLPVLTASGRGGDVMRPMALPIFGGMLFELLTLFVVPALWSWRAERRLRTGSIR